MILSPLSLILLFIYLFIYHRYLILFHIFPIPRPLRTVLPRHPHPGGDGFGQGGGSVAAVPRCWRVWGTRGPRGGQCRVGGAGPREARPPGEAEQKREGTELRHKAPPAGRGGGPGGLGARREGGKEGRWGERVEKREERHDASTSAPCLHQAGWGSEVKELIITILVLSVPVSR